MVVNQPAIYFRALSVSISGRLVLRDVSIELAGGGIVAILGPSGSGKSTFIRAVCGTREIEGVRRVSGAIGIAYQDLKLLPWLSVKDNISFGLEKIGEKDVSLDLLLTAGMNELADRKISSLSGGQRQRVALLRSLARNPDILLLDEPFSSLDFVSKQRMIELIMLTQKKRERLCLIVTHSIEDAVCVADQVLVINSGQLVDNFKLSDERCPEKRIKRSFEA
jgi:sulfonate transport system ATP-binding protein